MKVRALVFTTGTRDCYKLWQSLEALEHQLTLVRYDISTIDFETTARYHQSDLMIYIGACCDDFPETGALTPTPDQLAAANRVSPMVHLCSDAADPPWWPRLEAYQAAGSFKLQVAIDGNTETPIAKFGKVALTPVDPGHFHPVIWQDREVACGFSGGGGRRTAVVHGIRNHGAGIVWHNEEGETSYAAYCDFMLDCHMVLNDARTGSGEKRHVKGRVVETGLAGAVLLEPRDSPISYWFEPDKDFMQWGSIEEAADVIKHGADEEMAKRFQEKIIKHHSGPVFWREVFRELGL